MASSPLYEEQYQMRELVLSQLGRTTESAALHEAEQAATRRDFEERLAECGTLAYRIANSVVRNAAEAEDIAQDAMLRAFRRFDRLRDRNTFRAWLVRIAFRLALDRLRASKRRVLRETLWSQPDLRSPQPSVEDVAASNQFQSHLERALEELPEKQRLVLLLSGMEGHSIEEVALLLKLPVGTVKSRIFLARKKLAEKLRCHVNLSKTR